MQYTEKEFLNYFGILNYHSLINNLLHFTYYIFNLVASSEDVFAIPIISYVINNKRG